MYADFYGLKERPFALVPDPRYLFLSRSHREALAHLLYGIEAGEGFIEVVGQVGTGKTMLCRTLLGRVGTDVEIAYIFNPSPSETELLAAINREFGLTVAARSRADLIEELNRFLLEKRVAERRVLLVIDEAQNLEPAVLEQVRLLSNLETEREKLLQIVLIGQPELKQNLAREDLRQLRQRITVSWDLRPFDADEVGDYVNHRLWVAGLDQPDIFTRGAIRALYRASGGTPRVINTIADRALLAGYSAGVPKVTARMVRTVARELPSSQPSRLALNLGMPRAAAAGLLAAGLVAGFVATALWPAVLPSWRAAEIPPVSAPGAAVEVAPAAESESSVQPRLRPQEIQPPRRPVDVEPVVLLPAGPRDVHELRSHLLERGARVTMAGSLDTLLDQWGYYAPIRGELDPNLLASAVRGVSPLRVTVTRTSLPQLELIDLPAILELEPEPGERRYASLLTVAPSGSARLGLRGDTFAVDRGQLESLFTGRAFLLWANFEQLPAMHAGMNGSAVRWLQARLTDLDYLTPGHASGEFDGVTAQAISRFQSDYGLDDTGEVDPETMIALYQQLSYGAPRLISDEQPS